LVNESERSGVAYFLGRFRKIKAEKGKKTVVLRPATPSTTPALLTTAPRAVLLVKDKKTTTTAAANDDEEEEESGPPPAVLGASDANRPPLCD
jgi:hypothetical protein